LPLPRSLAVSSTRTWTEEELMALPRDGLKRELVDGRIQATPLGGLRHSALNVALKTRLAVHVEAHDLGIVLGFATGCWMPSGNLRIPDVFFVSTARLGPLLPEGFMRAVPDLVVEVLGPEDSPRLVLDAVGEYLESGARLVWVIDPATVRAAAYRSLTEGRGIDADGDLDGEDVVPGFRCALREIVH
jgi:Uma2 family endonuclease